MKAFDRFFGRDGFEKWFRKAPVKNPFVKLKNGAYKNGTVELAWVSWCESRKEFLQARP